MTAPDDVPIGGDACVLWLEETDQALDLELFKTLLSRAGRIYGPNLLLTAYMNNKIESSTLTANIGAVWSMSEYPDRALDRDDWRWLFDEAGYTVDGKPADRPTRDVTLYRGSVPERRADWSWTDRLGVAKTFAGGIRGRPVSRVWVCTAPPSALLCANTERGEAEYVIDTAGLPIELYDASDQSAP